MAGQLIERGDRTWLVRIYRGRNEAGKRQYLNKTVHGTKKQAQAELNRLLHQQDVGTLVEPTRETVQAFMQRWLDTSVKARVRPQTFTDYSYRVNKYILPSLGTRPLAALTPAVIQELYTSLTEQGLSPRMVRYTHSILHSAMEQATKWRQIPFNPSKLVDLPRQARSEKAVLTPAEAVRFLQAARSDPWYSLWCVLLYGGLRPSEALALRWSDLDGDKLRVQRVLIRKKGGGWTLDEPKTSRSRRTVPLPSTAVEALRAQRVRQAEQRLSAGAAWQDHGFIFAGETGQPLFLRNLTRRHFDRILAAANLPPMNLYGLRHSSATLLLAAGEHPKIVSERLGHSSVMLTLDTYSHVLPDMQQGAAAKLEALLS